jgi:hypothetical protein
MLPHRPDPPQQPLPRCPPVRPAHAPAPSCSLKYDDIPCVVNLAGRFDVSEGVERRLGAEVLRKLQQDGQVQMVGRSRARGEFEWALTREDVEDRLSTDVGAACAQIQRSAVLTIHGTAGEAPAWVHLVGLVGGGGGGGGRAPQSP